MSSIPGRFEQLRAEGRGAFIPYLTAGYPSMDQTVACAVAMAKAGADIIELGVPFSDPVADGPVIQRASEAALRAGATLERSLDAAAEVRRRADVGLVLFSYFNPLLQFGLDRLAGRLQEACVDGLLVTDVVPDEGEALIAAMRPRGVDTIFLAAPTSTSDRLERIADAATGFVYAVSRTGVTGARDSMDAAARELVGRIRAHTPLPVAVGFGISTHEQVRDVWQYADAAVVGSRIVAEIETIGDVPDLDERVAQLVRSLVTGA